MIVKLDEEELHTLIKHCVNEQVNLILEYAESRDKFVTNVYNIIPQIIENWCLIKFCTVTNRTETKKHWQTELYAHMSNINNQIIKKNNSYETRRKAIVEAFTKRNVNSIDDIIKMISKKFQIEKITSFDIISTVSEECTKSLDNIVSMLSLDNVQELNEYILSI